MTLKQAYKKIGEKDCASIQLIEERYLIKSRELQKLLLPGNSLDERKCAVKELTKLANAMELIRKNHDTSQRILSPLFRRFFPKQYNWVQRFIHPRAVSQRTAVVGAVVAVVLMLLLSITCFVSACQN